MITPIEIVQRNLRPYAGVPVVSKVPTTRPDLFIRVDMGAPQRETLVSYHTMIIVQVYGTDLEQVLDTIFGLQPRLEAMDVTDPLVLGWEEETGPVDFPDPDIPQHRWQLVGQLTHSLD